MYSFKYIEFYVTIFNSACQYWRNNPYKQICMYKIKKQLDEGSEITEFPLYNGFSRINTLHEIL
jgi:hypothetical protein